jgi:hypothetical protein
MSENQNGIMDTRLYDDVREVLELARSKAYAAVNFAMVEAYWNIGRLIAGTIGEDARNKYGKHLMRYFSERLTTDFGKGFDEKKRDELFEHLGIPCEFGAKQQPRMVSRQ